MSPTAPPTIATIPPPDTNVSLPMIHPNTNKTTTGTGQGSQNCQPTSSTNYRPITNFYKSPLLERSNTAVNLPVPLEVPPPDTNVSLPIIHPNTNKTTTGTGQGSQNCQQTSSTNYRPITNFYNNTNITITGTGQGSLNCQQRNSTNYQPMLYHQPTQLREHHTGDTPHSRTNN